MNRARRAATDILSRQTFFEQVGSDLLVEMVGRGKSARELGADLLDALFVDVVAGVERSGRQQVEIEQRVEMSE